MSQNFEMFSVLLRNYGIKLDYTNCILKIELMQVPLYLREVSSKRRDQLQEVL